MLKYYKDKFKEIMNYVNSNLDDLELLYLALHLLDTFKNRLELGELRI